MKNKILNKLDFVFFIVLFPLILSFITHFGFDSAYKEIEEIPNQYYEGVYKYRILAREMLIHMFNIVKTLNININLKGTLFYNVLFFFNTFFFLLSSFVLYIILSTTNAVKNKIYNYHFISTSLTSFSFYIIVPYDTLSYFLFLLCILFTIKYVYTNKKLYIIIFSILIVISTLNRETSALNLSFFMAFIFRDLTYLNIKSYIFKLFLPLISFILTYLLIRIYYSTEEFKTNDGFLLFYNLMSLKNIIGILFFIISIRLLRINCVLKSNVVYIYRFLIFSTPYLIIILLTGILWEIRLFIPIILGILILSIMKISKSES